MAKWVYTNKPPYRDPTAQQAIKNIERKERRERERNNFVHAETETRVKHGAGLRKKLLP